MGIDARAGRIPGAVEPPSRPGADPVVLGHPDDIRALLAHDDSNPLGDLEILAHDLPDTAHSCPTSSHPTDQRLAGPPCSAIPARLDAADRALRWQLRALVGTEFDAVAVLPEVCAHAMLPTWRRGPAPSLVSASVAAARMTVAYLDDGRAQTRWLPNRRLRRARDAQWRLCEEFGPGGDGPPVRTLSALATLTTVVPGIALAWLLFELVQRPDDRAHIRSEALSRPTSLDGHDLSTRTPYAHAFAREVLRLHPPVWLLHRTTGGWVRLAGFSLPPGQRVSFSPYRVHRDPRWWDEPELFAPERWLAGWPSNTPPHAYLPCGASQFGAELNITLLTLAAAQISAEYRPRIRRIGAVRPQFGALLRPSRLRVQLARGLPAGVVLDEDDV